MSESVFATDTIYNELFKIRKYLTPDGRWVRGMLVSNKIVDGRPACCVLGATDQVGVPRYGDTDRFMDDLTEHYGACNNVWLNDNVCKSQTDILLFLDWCIAVREWELGTGCKYPKAKVKAKVAK